jgi:formylglycine-generating enzyme required for sulfatase activity
MRFKIAITVTIVLFLILSGCTLTPANPQVPTTGPDPIFKVEQGSPLFESVGAPYDITADNCQGALDSVKTEERSRTYSTQLKLEVSHKVAAEVGGDIEVAKAMLSEEIGVALGVTIGAETAFRSSVTIGTPPGQRTVAHLQWEEVWTTGTIAVSRSDGTNVDILPFSVLNSLTLEQLGVQTIKCETGEVIENGSTVEISTPGTPVVVPTPATEIQDRAGITMVLIPAGEFSMGSDDSGDVASRPAHMVNLGTFYIDKYEVTNGMYKVCISEGICKKLKRPGSITRSTYYSDPVFTNYPVIYVDWKMAKTYCGWRGARLPTEAEWEKAARGTDGRTYPWGGDKLDCSFANYHGCVGDTTAVDQYAKGRSVYGVYGMAGNVWEWTSTLFRQYPYSATDGREDLDAAGERMTRGGSWYAFGGNSGNVRTDIRLKLDPNYYGPYVGFRCAMTK